MKITFLAAPALLAACAMLPPSDEPARTLAQAETAFAAHSVREDMRVAFLAHFAGDGVLARNGWTVAREFLDKRPAPPIVLDWRPQYVEAASSGDMGLSTGPWRITSRDKPGTPPAHGQFVSLWTRATGQPWRVLVDLGIPNEGPALWDAPLDARMAPTSVHPESLAAAEAAFAAASEHSVASAYRARGADALRLYRDGEPPRAALDSALASPWLAAHPRLAWVPERSETALSGDFGYVRGHVMAPGDVKPAGYFLRVWRREARGWRIVLDVFNAAAS